MKTQYTLRVYGLLLRHNAVLIARETYEEKFMVKFPGGGMEYGEGTLDTLRREFREELAVELTEIHHYYTTDFFVPSAFHKDTQVMSIYYKVAVRQPELLPIDRELQHDRGVHSFHWADLSTLEEAALTFPIDRHVLRMLKQEYTITD